MLQYTTAVSDGKGTASGLRGNLRIRNSQEIVFSTGLDLGSALIVFGISVAGNTASLDPGFSIGGKISDSENILGNLLGLLGMLGPASTYPFISTTNIIQDNQ